MYFEIEKNVSINTMANVIVTVTWDHNKNVDQVLQQLLKNR